MKYKNNKRLIIRLSIFCGLFFIFSVVFGINFLAVKNDHVNYKKSINGHAFTVLCEYMNNIEKYLSLAAVSDENTILNLNNEISGYAEGGKTALESLPVSLNGRGRLQEFFSECDEYMNYLSEKILQGEKMTPDDRKSIALYSAYAKKISERFNSIYNNVIGSDNIELVINSIAIDTPPDIAIKIINTNILSDNKNDNVIKTIKINEKQARITARKYLGEFASIRLALSNEDIFRFTSGSGFIDIKKDNGLITKLSFSHICADIKLNEAETQEIAIEFLESIGADNISQNYSFIKNGRCDFDFVCFIKNDCYNIRIGVTLDRGRITYFAIL